MTRDNHLQHNTQRAARLASYALLGLCLLTFVRGGYQLGEQSLWWDESLSHYRATQPLGFILSNQMTFVDGDKHVPITPDNHPPLYFCLLRGLLLVAGDSEFVLRFLSLSSGVLIVPLLYQCGRRLYGANSGLWAALLGAASPLYLWAQQEARPYALLTLLATLSFYALIRILQGPSSSLAPTGRRFGWTAAYLLSTLAMLATHYHGFLLLPAHGLAFVLAPSRRKRHTLAILLAMGAIALPLVLWAIRTMPRQANVPGYAYIPLGTLLQDVFRAFPLGVTGTASPLLRTIPFYWIGAGTLLTALAVLLVWRPDGSLPATLYLLLAMWAPIAAVYALSFVRPAYMNIRHLIAASPFYYLLLAAGIGQAVRLAWPQRLWASAAVGLGIGAVLIGMALSSRAYRTAYVKEDHRGWGRYLSEHVRPDDLVLINPGASAQLYFYYVQSQASWLGFPPLHAGAQETIRRLQEAVAQSERVWVAQSLTPHWANPDNLTIRWMRENASRFASADFESANTTVQAEGFLVRPPLVDALPPDAAPMALDFGDQLRLLGLDAPAKPLAAGRTLRLSLYWSPTRPLEQDYRMTLSLKDAQGFSWANQDIAPYEGGYPTRDWPAGRLVRHDLDIDIPPGTPPGPYTVHVSVYPQDRSEPALAAREGTTGNLQGLIVPVAQVSVVAPERPPRVGDIALAHRTPRRYGDLALLGHNNDPQTVYPGDVLGLDAYWEAVRAPRHDHAFSLQLAGHEDEVLTSALVPPAGEYAATQWRKGEVVKGQYRLRVPLDVPEGTYAVYAAFVPERRAWPWDEGRVQIGALTVRALDGQRTFEVPSIQHPLHGNLNDEVELLGYDLQSAVGYDLQVPAGVDRASVGPGQVVSCTLYWRALVAIERDYTVFTHLTAPDGRTWGQWDNQPQQGRAPTTRWTPGQVIADPYQIPVSEDAPPGPIELRVGMYDRRTMARLPALDENGRVTGDHIALAELEVTGQ